MRTSFDSQTPFSPKMSDDSDEGRQLREKARAAILRTRAKEFQHDSAGIELDYRCENSPICVSDGAAILCRTIPARFSTRCAGHFRKMTMVHSGCCFSQSLQCLQ
jgi:hypothetical protein